MSISKRRPIHIAILAQADLVNTNPDDPDDIHLERLIRYLNSIQKLFCYELGSFALNLGDYDKLHSYSNRKIFDSMGRMISVSDLKYAICIVSEELDDSSFNKHNKEDWTGEDTSNSSTKDMGLGVITIEDYKSYVPPSTKLHQYIAYLILCESFCIVSRHHIEHSERKYCLFDLCHDKKDLIQSIKHAYIHEGCLDKLYSYGFSEIDIEEANKIFRYVQKPNISFVLKKILNEPLISLSIGALVGIFINLLTEQNTNLSLYTTITILIIFLFLLVLFIGQWRKYYIKRLIK